MVLKLCYRNRVWRVEWINLVKDKGPVAYYNDDRKKKIVSFAKGEYFSTVGLLKKHPAPLAIRYSAMAGF